MAFLFSACKTCVARDGGQEFVFERSRSVSSRRKSVLGTTFHGLGLPTSRMIHLYNYLRKERPDLEIEGEKVVDDHLFMLRLTRRVCDDKTLTEEGREARAIMWMDQYAEYRNSRKANSTFLRPLRETPLNQLNDWFEEKFPSELREQFPLQVFGRNNQGYPVVYYTLPSPELFGSREYEDVRDFLIAIMESVERINISLRDIGEQVYGHVLCVNAAELSFGHVGPFSQFRKHVMRLGKEVFQQYINCTARVVCINAPSIIKMAWKVLTSGPSPMVTQQQQQMFSFAESPLEGLKGLGVSPDQIPRDMGGEASEEMRSFYPVFKEEIDYDRTFSGEKNPENFFEIWDCVNKPFDDVSQISTDAPPPSATKAPPITKEVARTETGNAASLCLVLILLLCVMLFPRVPPEVFWASVGCAVGVLITAPQLGLRPTAPSSTFPPL